MFRYHKQKTKDKPLSTLIYTRRFARQTVRWISTLKELFIAADNFLL